jgi:hypothetical protein
MLSSMFDDVAEFNQERNLYVQRVRGAAPIDTSEIEPGAPNQDIAAARMQMNRRYQTVYPAESNRAALGSFCSATSLWPSLPMQNNLLTAKIHECSSRICHGLGNILCSSLCLCCAFKLPGWFRICRVHLFVSCVGRYRYNFGYTVCAKLRRGIDSLPLTPLEYQ